MEPRGGGVSRRGRQTCLYRFYDVQGYLLYVGITNSLEGRTSNHRSTKPWWGLVATMTVERFPSRAEAEIAERVAIRDELPAFNVQRFDPGYLARHGFKPVVSVCWVCQQPVVEQLDDEYDPEVLTRDHMACSDAVVHAYEQGMKSRSSR